MKSASLILLATLSVTNCATESSQTIRPQEVISKSKPFSGKKQQLVVGKFDNRSSYGRGLFSDGKDRLGSQAKTILKTHLQQTGRFLVLDRANLKESEKEAAYNKQNRKIIGAKYVVTGNVTEFGRRVVGDKQLFGLIGQGKQQIAYAKVMINIVDVETSAIVHSTQASGEFKLSNREILGTGGSAGYDSTLNGKVLDLAIREAVNRLVDEMPESLAQH